MKHLSQRASRWCSNAEDGVGGCDFTTSFRNNAESLHARARGARVSRRVGAAIVALLVCLSGCSFVVSRPHEPSAASRAALDARQFRVIVETYDWTDTSRRAGSDPSRALPTRVYVPTYDGSVAPGPFPLFVWAHGIDATAASFDSLLRAVASRGYVVAAPTFPLTRRGGQGANRFFDYANQPKDVSFVISHVLDIDGTHGSVHPELVDPTRIAVGGHSLGAVTTVGLVSNTCCLDPRIRAAVEVDGAPLAFPNGASTTRAVPLLVVHGSDDILFPLSDGEALYAAAASPKYLIVLHGAPHTPFGIPWAESTIVTSIENFLDAYLKHEPTAGQRLLTDGDIPGRASITHVG